MALKYVTVAQFKEAMAPDLVNDFAQDAGDAAPAVETTIEEILTRTEEWVDGFLADKDTTSAKTKAALLPRVLDVGMFRMYQRRMASRVPESATTAYKSAEKYLENVAKGDINLPGLVDVPVDSVPLDEGASGSDAPVFHTEGGWGSF